MERVSGVTVFVALSVLSFSSSAQANDWEKYFNRFPGTEALIASSEEPERLTPNGDLQTFVASMWKRGYAAIGYSSFNSSNSKVKDAERLAKKLKARYYVAATDLTSSQMTSVPLTLPNTTTSTTNGNFSVNGTGGYASGNYGGTTTTYGTKTTYIPMTINRFDKVGVYFAEVPREGTGIFPRELTPEEISKYETQRGFGGVVVRDGSPAYNANILPGDVITQVNGMPADIPNWKAAMKTGPNLSVKLFRNGDPREIVISVPEEWRPK